MNGKNIYTCHLHSFEERILSHYDVRLWTWHIIWPPFFGIKFRWTSRSWYTRVVIFIFATYGGQHPWKIIIIEQNNLIKWRCPALDSLQLARLLRTRPYCSAPIRNWRSLWRHQLPVTLSDVKLVFRRRKRRQLDVWLGGVSVDDVMTVDCWPAVANTL